MPIAEPPQFPVSSAHKGHVGDHIVCIAPEFRGDGGKIMPVCPYTARNGHVQAVELVGELTEIWHGGGHHSSLWEL